MPTGGFNISELARQLGEKGIIEMPVSKNIQLTMPLDTMAGQVPAHVAGVAMFGGLQTLIAGEASTFALQCLDPGGGIVVEISNCDVPYSELEVTTTAPAWLTGPTACARQDFTNNPCQSVAFFGTQAVSVVFDKPIISTKVGPPVFAPLYVPRGSWLILRSIVVASIRRWAVTWCGISATESVP